MKATLQREIDRLTVAVTGLRRELRMARRSADPASQVTEAIESTRKLSNQIEQLGALVERMKE